MAEAGEPPGHRTAHLRRNAVMNRRLAKLSASFALAVAGFGLAGCGFLPVPDSGPAPVTTTPDPLPTNEISYVADSRTDLCFAVNTTITNNAYSVTSITNLPCNDHVKKAAAGIKIQFDQNMISYDTDQEIKDCFAIVSSYNTVVPCTDKVLGLIPTRIGTVPPPQMEGWNTGTQDDLDASIPGTSIALGGDNGNPGFPLIYVPGVYEGRNPLPVPPNNRPLPTGTAVGPHGEHYGFYAIVPFAPDPSTCTYTCYTSADTVVVDLTHPGTPLFTLRGISQASGAYDAQSDRMIILGNTQNGDRALWQSDPISQNPAWGNTLQFLGAFSGAMNGNRESQIVALPPGNGRSGGFLVVGAGEAPIQRVLGFVVGGGTLPIEAVTAPTPQGLLTARATELVTPWTLPQVYGPTITDIQETNGKDVVSMRVSTYGDPASGRYDPHTYKTTFTIKS